MNESWPANSTPGASTGCSASASMRSLGGVDSTLEHELLSRRDFATKDQARRQVAHFVDAYNHRRRHSSCEMLPPVANEAVLAERTANAAREDRAA